MMAIESKAYPVQGMGEIQARHLERVAIVYVRPSTYQQVLEHRESAAIQYGLRCRATEWGWAAADQP